MILECEYCFSRIIIKPDDEIKINFCPHCGEPTDDDAEELDFNGYIKALHLIRMNLLLSKDTVKIGMALSIVLLIEQQIKSI
jgi:DNA-directed RNA polymerase subunit RPC12/RpoP